jgi:hypothetical protein
LSLTGLKGQGDLLIAKKNAVAFIGNALHGADGLEVKRTVACSRRKHANLSFSLSSTGAGVGELGLSGFQSALISVGDSVISADLLECWGAAGLNLAICVEDLFTTAVVHEIDAGGLEGAEVGVGGVVISANFLVAPDAEGVRCHWSRDGGAELAACGRRQD